MVTVSWSSISGEGDELWESSRVLYAYLHPKTDKILYIGKADGTSTVGSRFGAQDKDELWEALEDELGVPKVAVIVGEVELPPGDRLTRQLLADIESLLINKVKPWGNIQSKKTRPISRPGMVVQCEGDWPGRSVYRDR